MSGPPTVEATRYVAPLREGGSLPAGEIGRALGRAVPVIAFVDLDPALGQAEPDPEIQDLLRAGDAEAGPIARLPVHQRFHWLMAPSSTSSPRPSTPGCARIAR